MKAEGFRNYQGEWRVRLALGASLASRCMSRDEACALAAELIAAAAPAREHLPAVVEGKRYGEGCWCEPEVVGDVIVHRCRRCRGTRLLSSGHGFRLCDACTL
jgi:hypothetical protein